jgi:hypothetical protein
MEWRNPEDFRHFVAPSMSVGMFGSYAESFCLTAADFVSAGVPCVLSCHIPWAYQGCPTDVNSLANKLHECLMLPKITADNQASALQTYLRGTRSEWAEMLAKVGQCH